MTANHCSVERTRTREAAVKQSKETTHNKHLDAGWWGDSINTRPHGSKFVARYESTDVGHSAVLLLGLTFSRRPAFSGGVSHVQATPARPRTTSRGSKKEQGSTETRAGRPADDGGQGTLCNGHGSWHSENIQPECRAHMSTSLSRRNIEKAYVPGKYRVRRERPQNLNLLTKMMRTCKLISLQIPSNRPATKVAVRQTLTMRLLHTSDRKFVHFVCDRWPRTL